MTEEDAKTRFKELAKQLHPDRGGNEEEFKQMCNEYSTYKEQLLRKTNTEYEDWEIAEITKDEIVEFIHDLASGLINDPQLKKGIKSWYDGL